MASRRKRRGRGLGWLVVLILLVVGGYFFFQSQQNWLQVERITATSPRLPEAFEGFKIAQVSDLHGTEFGPDNRALLEKIRAEAPDLIAITGDLADENTDLSLLPALAQALVSIAPTYYVTGNHEWTGIAWQVKEILRSSSVTVLEGDYLLLEREGQHIALAGVDDPNGRRDQTTHAQLAEGIRAQEGDIFTLLLAHRNERYAEYAAAGWDLTLTGHAHGGLIRLPFVGGLIGNDRRFFPDHTAGMYELGDGKQVFVSRGLGNIGRTFRLFNRPHLPIITLAR